MYDDAPETQDIAIGTEGRITFCRHFKYLGSHISYHLRDDVDIEHRIAKASAAMGALNPFWSNPAVDLKSKYLIFCAIPTNLLLWGCESWSLRKDLLRKLEVFFHRSIRRILGIRILQVKEERITNESVRTRFMQIPSLADQLAKRQLTFLGRIVRNRDDQLPTKLITAWCNHPCKRGGFLQDHKKNIARNVQKLIPSAAKDGHGVVGLLRP